MKKLPLEGIRILDSGYVFALPYAGGLMADMGAEVIKVEGPGWTDDTRNGGFSASFPENQVVEDWWDRSSTYNLLNRGKSSITLDLTNPRCRDIFRDLVRVSDVVMENYTPRVMRGWGLDYEALIKAKPDIIMVSNTGYGHGQGPYSGYPTQATTQEATHGHCWITGYPDGPPSRAGMAFVDFPSAWAALFAVGMALRHRNRTGQGQWIDLAMYQTGAMLISEYLMDYMANGRLGGRRGNRHPFRAPQGCYRAEGVDQWIAISVGSDEQWQAMCGLMGQPHLTHDPRFEDTLTRIKNHDRLDAIINRWTEKYDKYRLMEILQSAGIPAGPVFSNRDTHMDPHFKARGFLEYVEYPQERGIGARPFIGRPYKFSKTPLKIQGPAPTLGQHNGRVLKGLLGIDEKEYQEMESTGMIGTVPTEGEPVIPDPIARQLQRGSLASWDPDYKEASA